MAKIPIFPPNYITVTQIFPILQVDAAGNPSVTANGTPLGFALNITASATLNVNDIVALGEFFDQYTGLPVNARQIYLAGVTNAMIIQDSYNTIKAHLDAIDCTDLCSDV
jgi:hypothetical protein